MAASDQLRTRRVFINCPFDRKFKPIFDAIVFTLYDLGFKPEHALNKSVGEELRLRRIYKQLRSCANSIHDISRVSLSGPLQLPRFNMPFEAGIAYAMHASATGGRRHGLLFLDAKEYQYQASVSDLAGLDPKIHENDPVKVIAAVRTFFAQHNPTKSYNPAPYIQRRYLTFSADLPAKARKLKFSARLLRTWDYVQDLEFLMAGWIDDNP